jgi:hypothetical protein
VWDLRGRLSSLRAQIYKEKGKNVEELQTDRVLGLCTELDELIKNYAAYCGNEDNDDESSK